MTIETCLAKLVAAKQISQRQSDDALALYRGAQGRLYPAMGPASAEAASALEVAKIMAQAAKERKLKAARQAITYAQSLDRMEKHPKGKTFGLQSIIVRDNFEAGQAMGNAINIDSHSEAVTKRLLGMMDGALQPYASRMAGLSQDTESVWNIARELFGEDTGDDAAKAAARGWEVMTAYAVQRVKRAGLPVSVLEDWRLPQRWDGERIKKFSQDKFVDAFMKEYEGGHLRVMDAEGNGEAPRAAVPGIIANAYDSIIKGQGGGSGGGGFSNQLRVFRFNNADSFMRMQKEFGMGDGGLYNTLMGHISGMGKKIAVTELMGPNADANFNKLLQIAKDDDAVRNRGFVSKAIRSISMNSPAAVKRTYDAATGKLDEVSSDTIAAIFGAARTIQTGAKLGSAIVSAIPGDSATAALAANHLGMPVTDLLTRLVADLSTNREGAEQIARRINVTAANLVDVALGSKRFADEVVGQGLTGRVTDSMMRVTGINTWTEGLKRTFALELNGWVAEQAAHAFEKLDPKFRGFLERYGFTPQEWDDLRVTPQLEFDGARFFDVNGVENQQLGDRLMSAMIDERRFAVIEPDSRVRGFSTGGRMRGTLGGEMVRNATQFKSFPLTFAMTHLMRSAMQDGAWNKASYFAKLTILATMAGAFTAQMGTIITGRDPQDMSTGQFWLQAFVRGGGAGMAGDFLYSATSRNETSVWEYLGGPVNSEAISTGFDAWNGGVALFQHLTGSEQMNTKELGKAVAKHVKAWTPGSSLWFAKLAFDRLLFDQVQSLTNPDYRESFRRYEDRMRQEFGQEFWWAPGETEPRRGPQMPSGH